MEQNLDLKWLEVHSRHLAQISRTVSLRRWWDLKEATVIFLQPSLCRCEFEITKQKVSSPKWNDPWLTFAATLQYLAIRVEKCGAVTRTQLALLTHRRPLFRANLRPAYHTVIWLCAAKAHGSVDSSSCSSLDIDRVCQGLGCSPVS